MSGGRKGEEAMEKRSEERNKRKRKKEKQRKRDLSEKGEEEVRFLFRR